MCQTIKNGEFVSKQINIMRHDFQSLLSTYPLNVPWITVKLTCWNLDHLHLAYILYLGWQLWGPSNHLESETNSLALVFNKSIWSLLSLFTHHNLQYVLFKQLVHQVMTQCSGSSKSETLEHTSIKRSHGSQTVDDNLNDDRKPGKLFPKQPKEVHLRVLKR
jgi:hypothetical protein